ncbi:hypothetical protein EVAR_440_1 [Eumeta japonica]|uniref:Uncharacterized protein n=1 Tax=Eumeta variegata TaxID=151549 RepID=A0A4C1SD33_EUMVA|nr:hypothetical protein EVAR_440_1 [Eumeta japonica]
MNYKQVYSATRKVNNEEPMKCGSKEAPKERPVSKNTTKVRSPYLGVTEARRLATERGTVNSRLAHITPKGHSATTDELSGSGNTRQSSVGMVLAEPQRPSGGLHLLAASQALASTVSSNDFQIQMCLKF